MSKDIEMFEKMLSNLSKHEDAVEKATEDRSSPIKALKVLDYMKPHCHECKINHSCDFFDKVKKLEEVQGYVDAGIPPTKDNAGLAFDVFALLTDIEKFASKINCHILSKAMKSELIPISPTIIAMLLHKISPDIIMKTIGVNKHIDTEKLSKVAITKNSIESMSYTTPDELWTSVFTILKDNKGLYFKDDSLDKDIEIIIELIASILTAIIDSIRTEATNT